MAILTEDAFKKQLSAGKIAPITLIFGDDGYLKKRYVDKIVRTVTDPDDPFNFASFGAECDLQDVYDALSQFPMMAEKKCVILCDYDFEHCAKSDLEKLYSLCSEAIDTALFVIWFNRLEIDARKSAKLKKIVTLIEKCGGVAAQCDHRRPQELVKMLVDGAAKRGCKFEPTAAKYLVELAGEDIHTLINELDKLCAYRPGEVIGKDTVERVCIKTVEASVYNLSKMIFARRPDAALHILDDLFFMRVEPMVIFYTVSGVYVDLFRIYAGKRSKKSIPEIAKEFGYKGREFVLERAAQNLSKIDFQGLCRSFDILRKTDEQLKSVGAYERVILEQMIIRLTVLVNR